MGQFLNGGGCFGVSDSIGHRRWLQCRHHDRIRLTRRQCLCQLDGLAALVHGHEGSCLQIFHRNGLYLDGWDGGLDEGGDLGGLPLRVCELLPEVVARVEPGSQGCRLPGGDFPVLEDRLARRLQAVIRYRQDRP